MPGCCAPNCSRHSRNGVRLFVFPKDVKRREIWLQMCRCDKWIPSNHSKLCEFHFEESQFEKHREDKWKKLKPNAIPTIFDVPNKPKLITLKRKTRSNNRVKSPLKENISPGGDEGSTAEGSVMMDCDTVTELLPQLGESSKGVTEINKLENKIKLLNRQLWRTQKEVLSLKKKNRIFTEKIEKLPFLNEHLISILSSGHKKVLKWPPEILKQAVQIRFAVGWKGYKYLRKELGYPLPSYSTLCRHLQKMEYHPGLLNNLLPYLASKRETQEIHETDCILLIDEMELQKALEYDKSSGAFFGYVTSPRESNKEAELGSQLMVFMLRGLNTNWKQVVGWHITSKSSDTNEMFAVINNIIHEIENIGYKIWGITSDMGPKNQAVWKKFGVRVGRYSDMPSIQHPIRKENVLYFFADVPHLLKNLRSAFMSHTIILPAHIVQAENLSSNTIDFKYLLKIHTIQEKKDLKLAPKITKNVLEPSNFEKMNVSYAAHIFSVQTAAAIETLVKLELISSKAMTTAWFIRKVRSWFDALNGRVLKQAFTKKNKKHFIKNINSFLDLIEHIKIGNAWKPVQTGIILTSKNIINLSEKLFQNGYKYILTSRFNQDALENLFSVLRRHGNTNPTPLQARRCLKLITVCQFVDSNSESKNYEDDNDIHYVDFFKNPVKKIERPTDICNLAIEDCIFSVWDSCESDCNDENIEPIKDPVQCNIINNLIGCAIYKVLKNKQMCSSCKKQFVGRETIETYTILTQSYSLGGLKTPTNILYYYINRVEKILSLHLTKCKSHPKLTQHLLHMVQKNATINILSCTSCKALDCIVKEYINIRKSIALQKSKNDIKLSQKKKYASKSTLRSTIR